MHFYGMREAPGYITSGPGPRGAPLIQARVANTDPAAPETMLTRARLVMHVEATLPGIGTRRWPWHNDASYVPNASSSWSGPNTSATRGMKSQQSASGRPGPTNGSAAGAQMSLSHAKGLPDQHRALADGTPGRL